MFAPHPLPPLKLPSHRSPPSAATQGVTAFLPKSDAAAAGRQLAPGSLLEVVVGAGGLKPGGAGAGSVTVGCAPEAVAGAVAREWEGLNIGEAGRGGGVLEDVEQ